MIKEWADFINNVKYTKSKTFYSLNIIMYNTNITQRAFLIV